LDERTRLIKFLKTHDIHPVFHYVPLHNAPKGVEIRGGKVPNLPVTEEYADRLLRLPCYYELTLEQVWRICEIIAEFFEK
jgi:dTDP-4-amino-4,6-dideoxygalactose transaminase